MARTSQDRDSPEPIAAPPEGDGAAGSPMAARSAQEATPAQPLPVKDGGLPDYVANTVPPDPISVDRHEAHDASRRGDAGPAAAEAAVAYERDGDGPALHAAPQPQATTRANREDPARAVAQLDGGIPGSPEEPPARRNGIEGGGIAGAPEPADEIFTDAPPGGAQPPPFRFFVDGVSDKEISGWITKPDEPSHRCIVVLQEGDRVLGRTIASRFRTDLISAGIGDGCYSFVIPLPPALFDGDEHLIEIIEQETGFPLTAEPIRWRSERILGQTGLGGMAGRMGVARRFGLGQQPSPEAESETMWARADDGIARPPVAEGRQLGGSRQLGAARTRAPALAVVGTRVLFDISDLVYYIGEHANLTGIQRVQSSIVLAILTNRLLPRSNLIFLSFNHKTRNLVSIPTGFLISLLEDLFLPESQRLASFPAEEARYGLLPGAQEFDGVGVLDDGNPSVLCLLGAAWVHQDYLHRVLALKRRFGTKFVMTVHDLIPIYARDTCDQDTAWVFEEFMRRALRHTDHILSVSENTAKDIKHYLQSLQFSEPPITVTKNGSSFAEFLPKGGPAGDLRPEDVPERFVLFVATIEGRKNHRLMLDIWRRMIADGDDPPHLVCVGRLGWKSSTFISTLVETGYLGGRVLLLRDISDTDLTMLYSRCLFTVCPTLYEGWGLPVGESLAMGKICVSSDRASVPEVAGQFGVYIDIDSFEESWKAVRGLILDEPARKKLEVRIRRGYKPITWHAVAEKVVAACLAAPKTKWQEPYPYTAIPYSSEISFGRLDRTTDGTGELLLTRIEGARRGLFLSDPLHEQSFLWGEEARSVGNWAQPEDWGTWACHSGGEIAVGLPANDSPLYYVFLRLRASGSVFERPIRLLANGEKAWEGALGSGSRDIVLRIRRRAAGVGGWRLRIQAQIALTAELRAQVAALDSRVPTIGFERLIVVPESDVKTRVDIMYSLLL